MLYQDHDRARICNYVNAHPEVIMARDRCGNGFICPLCGSGSGKHGTGLTSKDKVHYTCWACGQIRHNDVIDIIGIIYGITSFVGKVRKAAELYNI